MNRILFLLAFLFCVLPAQAADKFCGIDTDLNGSVDNWCPLPDEDGDGFPVNSLSTGPFGAGVVDTDDQDFFDHPGQPTTKGCGAGQYRTAQSNGTYTSCANISTYTCHTGAGSTRWYSSLAANCTSYTYASPANWFCFSNPGLANYHASVPGDCHVLKIDGDYTGSWGGINQIHINGTNGTLADPITIRGEPGASYSFPKLVGANLTALGRGTIVVTDSDYVNVFSIKIDGDGDGSGYSESGIHFEGTGSNALVKDVIIYDVGGEQDNNLSGVKFRETAPNAAIYHALIKNVYERGAGLNQNSTSVRFMDVTGNNITWFTRTANDVIEGNGPNIKHATNTTNPFFQYNFVENVLQYGIGTENKDSIVTNNWIKGCSNNYGFFYGAISGTLGWWKDSVFSQNTVQNCGLLNAAVDWSTSPAHPSYSGTTIVTVEDNLTVDSNPSYDGDCGDGIVRTCENNCNAGELAAAAGKVIYNSNVYYNPVAANLRFCYFGNSGGASYSTLAGWQGSIYGPFDAGAVNADPGINNDGLSALYPDVGWREGMFITTPSVDWGIINNRLTRGLRR